MFPAPRPTPPSGSVRHLAPNRERFSPPVRGSLRCDARPPPSPIAGGDAILHPPVDDPQSGELPCERWNPTQNVRTILLSVISLLNEPNTFSPANVDASVMYRRWRDSKGRDKEYENIIRKQAMAARAEAEREGIQDLTTYFMKEDGMFDSDCVPTSQEEKKDLQSN
ncbi:hypothetical protein ILUMI_02240 [Ignelater luminosus]|uniref:UBC core domain-containing protein n=1 Tax=Ignelater luminosus TaxID=2038154 RepID=A0A8K0DII4_IGNLU|nr:hypothetical protein ILUMI_02240 [Ignelater luminosus]